MRRGLEEEGHVAKASLALDVVVAYTTPNMCGREIGRCEHLVVLSCYNNCDLLLLSIIYTPILLPFRASGSTVGGRSLGRLTLIPRPSQSHVQPRPL